MRRPDEVPVISLRQHLSGRHELNPSRYKGMATGASTTNPSKNVTPQVTGFSQVQPRNTAESQGGNMGVFLSWHEKVTRFPSSAHYLSGTDHALFYSLLKSPVQAPSYASCQTAEPFKTFDPCILRQYPIRSIQHHSSSNSPLANKQHHACMHCSWVVTEVDFGIKHETGIRKNHVR